MILANLEAKWSKNQIMKEMHKKSSHCITMHCKKKPFSVSKYPTTVNAKSRSVYNLRLEIVIGVVCKRNLQLFKIKIISLVVSTLDILN